jgi:hypothetical protein
MVPSVVTEKLPSVTPPGIDHETVRLVAQCLNGIRVTGRQRRRRKLLLGDVKEKRGYCKLKEETIDGTLWGTRFGRRYGPAVRQTAG